MHSGHYFSATLILGGTVNYSYDAEGQRIRKAAGSTVEEYVYDSAGHQFAAMQPNTAVTRVEHYASARHLATYDSASNATYFIHGDWQGTERLRTNVSGASYETCTNLPFGDNQVCAGGADISPMHFTGKPRDAETNLDYFGARYYNSAMARWMSPDWADKPTAVPYAQFGDPQSLNLYGYVTDNPVSRQDGDGHLITIYQLYSNGSGQHGMSTFSGIDMDEFSQFSRDLWASSGQNANKPATAAPGQKPTTQLQETACQQSKIYVMLGNPDTIGEVGAFPYGKDGHGGKIEKDSAAVDPAQFGGETGEDIRGIADQVHGTINMGFSNLSFKNVRDVVGSQGVKVTDPKTNKVSTVRGAAAREAIRGRYPGSLVIELPGLSAYPKGTTTPVFSGTVYVPTGTACPTP